MMAYWRQIRENKSFLTNIFCSESYYFTTMVLDNNRFFLNNFPWNILTFTHIRVTNTLTDTQIIPRFLSFCQATNISVHLGTFSVFLQVRGHDSILSMSKVVMNFSLDKRLLVSAQDNKSSKERYVGSIGILHL